MKLNADNGKITLDGGAEVGSQMQLSDFLAGVLSVGVRVLVENSPYISYAVNVPNEKLSLSIFFKDQVLESVRVSIKGPEFGSGWNDWSKENELRRKSANDAWLAHQGISTANSYPWGTVWSGFDAKGGFSSIVVRYESANHKGTEVMSV